jgi:glycosyltransferase involved in cell wall biosynthesis
MAEVAGDAALLVDPHDLESIAWGMTTISSDSALREALVCKGNEVVKRFSWDTTAQKTIAALGL